MRHASKLLVVLSIMTGCVGGDEGDGVHVMGGGGKADEFGPDGGLDPDAGPDIFAEARDVTKATIKFPDGTVAPTSYNYPAGNAAEMRLSGTEFWQKWSGGLNPTYSFSEGTDAGRLCMQASAVRFEAIMADAPAELVQLKANSNWSGSFFNWNDDYSKSDYGDASGPRLWAWRTSLIKWISQTAKDGTCHLPTRELVIKAAAACLERGQEIQGCSASL